MSGEGLTVSPSRTYVVVLHDIVASDEARFEKIVLPEWFKNNSQQARYYFCSIAEDRAARILSCQAFEDFMSNASGIFEDFIFQKPKEERVRYLSYKTSSFSTNSSISLEKDMTEVRQMLDVWNDEQEHTSTTYAMIMRAILRKLELQKRLVAQINVAANFIKDA